jgi:hypothetical protein
VKDKDLLTDDYVGGGELPVDVFAEEVGEYSLPLRAEDGREAGLLVFTAENRPEAGDGPFWMHIQELGVLAGQPGAQAELSLNGQTPMAGPPYSIRGQAADQLTIRLLEQDRATVIGRAILKLACF